MNFRQLDAFRAVMLTGTATEAARLLSTSQPAVSRLIHQLEHAGKITLFELRRGRLIPTPEARALYREIERSYTGLDRVREAITSLRDSGVGRIAIGTLPSLGMSIMPKAVMAFLRLHPGVSVSLQTARSALVRDGVASGLFDIGFAAEEIDGSGLSTELVATTREVCVIARKHRLAHKRSVRPRDLKDDALIMINGTDHARRRVDQVFEAEGVSPRVAVETTFGATVCALALEGVGVGFVNALIAIDFMSRGLVVRNFEPAVSFNILSLYAQHAPPSRLALKFADCVRAELKSHKGITVHPQQ